MPGRTSFKSPMCSAAIIVDFGQSTLIIAVVGAAEKIKAILKLLDDYGILETGSNRHGCP